MTNSSDLGLFALICVLGGAVHTLAPDHWVPASILSWQRGWRLPKLTAFALLAFASHIFLGFLIYWFLLKMISQVPSSAFLVYSLFLVGSVALVRGIRFKRIREVLRTGPKGFWGGLTVFSLLGPCESIIPILVKSRQLGMGYFIPTVAFLVGTFLAGMALITSGRMVWNRPLWLPKGIQLSGNGAMTLPVMAGVMLSLALLVKL